MYKSKLFELLKSLDEQEVMSFQQYLLSPFFNNSQKCIELYQYFLKVYPNWKHESLQKEQVFKKIFPNKDINKSSSLRELSSKTLRLLEDFLIVQELQVANDQRDWFLLQALEKRKKVKRFQQKHQQIQRDLLQKKQQDIDYALQDYRLEEQLFNFEIANNQNNKTKDTLWQVIKKFEYYALLKKLELYSSLLNRQVLKGKKYDLEELEYLLDWIEKNHLDKQHPIIALYYLTILMLKTKEERYFFRLKQLIYDYGQVLDKKELKTLLTIAINYSTLAINQNQEHFKLERFELYFYQLKQQLLHSGKYIHFMHLKNICTIAIQAQKIEVAQNIVEEYKHEVAPEYVEDVYYFNKGMLEFYTGNYQDSIYFLHQVGYINVFYQLDCRMLLLRAYYELEESNALLDLAQAFKRMLQREKKLSKRHKEAYHNFILVLVKLYRIKALFSTKSLEKLKEEILQKKLINQAWLLEKLDELE